MSAPARVKGERIEVDISDLADGMKWFGRLEDGLAVFVEGPAAVGDRVAARLTRIKPQYLEARLDEVLRPAPARVAPPCPHFGACGGCKWQHAGYDEQLRLKRKLVADALAHLGGLRDAPVEPILPAPAPLGYRNKMEFSFGARRFLLPGERGDDGEFRPLKPVDFALGLHAPQRYDKVVDLDACLLATPEMNEALAEVRAFCLERKLPAYRNDEHAGLLRHLVLRHARGTGEFMVNLVTSTHEPDLMAELDARLAARLGPRLTTFLNSVTARRSDVAVGERLVVLRGDGFITERLGGLAFRISPFSFFQTNTAQAERLAETVRDFAAAGPGDLVLDLYCGTGALTLFLAPGCREAVGLELDEGAVQDARRNAAANGTANARFLRTDLKHLRAALAEAAPGGRPAVVVTDPPRAGMHPDAVAALRDVAPRRIVYVSCNPSSLARDAAALCAGGSYVLRRVRPVDMFPHTHHVESVALLENPAAP